MASSLGRNILVVATSIALVAVIAGVIVLDTPAEARQGQLDRERVSHLQGIMRGTDGFLTRYERLPASMMELAQDPRIRITPTDPGSGQPYEYTILGDERYELCATFDRQSVVPPDSPGADFWTHPAGRYCFELEPHVTP